jgi:predicted NBD/HSP70 family sugar kinase
MAPAQQDILVIELGGSNLRAALFDPDSHTLSRRIRRPVPNRFEGTTAADLHHAVLDAVRAAGVDILGDRRPAVVAVAYPGPVDDRGWALAAPTILGGDGGAVPLRDACREMWPGARVEVMNDLTAAGYRYVDLGLRDFCVLTVGSGIGHKVFLGGRPQLGEGFRGGEIGHLRVDPDPSAPVCDCGARGHVGGIASGRGTVRLARAAAAQDPIGYRTSRLFALAGPDPTGIEAATLAEAFASADPWVRDVVSRAVSHLGTALAAIHLAVGVERFVIVGGFALALGEDYRAMMVGAAEAATWRVGQDWDRMIELGIPDDDDGMIGAGLAATASLGPTA